MHIQDLMKQLHRENNSRIVLAVADGLGGLARDGDGSTELETAHTPYLDRLAKEGTCGLITPVLPGITCGSGPGHLALFGYDPLKYRIGRGVLSALGIDFDLRAGDIAARGNFCTLGDDGKVTDRRAGRISHDEGVRLTEKLRRIQLRDVQLFIEPVMQHRFALILRGKDLGERVSDTDPQVTGLEPLEPRGEDVRSRRTAKAVQQFLDQARDILSGEHPANMVILRGFSLRPEVPSFGDLYGLKACAVASYPMYRGLSRLLGMDVERRGADLSEQIDILASAWERCDFFFLHYKDTDSHGEDGDFDGKVRAIEAFDEAIGRVVALAPDVLIVTGDHSSPSRLRGHSWHPVPAVLTATTCRVDQTASFGETECAGGGLGHIEGKYLMALALAHAGRLNKFGA